MLLKLNDSTTPTATSVTTTTDITTTPTVAPTHHLVLVENSADIPLAELTATRFSNVDIISVNDTDVLNLKETLGTHNKK